MIEPAAASQKAWTYVHYYRYIAEMYILLLDFSTICADPAVPVYLIAPNRMAGGCHKVTSTRKLPGRNEGTF